MPDFQGTFEYAMDGRGRVPLPPRYRDTFAEGGVLARGAPDLCLRLFTPESFEQQARLAKSRPLTSRAGRVARRVLLPHAFDVKLDGQGRILIPGPLRAYAGLERNVIVIGMGECFEIWQPQRLQAFEQEMTPEELEQILESMELGP